MPYYMCAIGTALLAAGLWLLVRRLAILPRAHRVRGRIVRWEARRDHDSPNAFHYFPHVHFVDRRGVAHEMRVDIGYATEKWPIGHAFEVRYDPTDPSRAYPAKLGQMLVGPLAIVVLGAASLAGGVTGLR
jgi:Protein of unknown function (DUF3592)